jgi:alanine dehydrogenase
MSLLSVGVIGNSLKENERRVPIHPDHFGWIPEKLRRHLIFETGYGTPFDVTDDAITSMMGGTAARADIFRNADIVLIPKPMQEDFDQMKERGILWGWAHVVQQTALAQTAIDSRLTLITWESMNIWTPGGDWLSHIFYKNNEIAGYAGVQHALDLAGTDGSYGPKKKVVVINFGSVSRGSIYALRGRGFNDITVFTLQPSDQVANQVTGISYRQIVPDGSGGLLVVNPDGSSFPFIEEVESSDIIVNGILQDTDAPLMFVQEEEVNRLRPGCLIIDISCDEGMGFPFARPTSFENPVFKVGSVTYYAVDHTPSYLWNSASWEISRALLPFLPIVMAGHESWERNETIRRAIEIREGVVENQKIISFQHRSPDYPHPGRS